MPLTEVSLDHHGVGLCLSVCPLSGQTCTHPLTHLHVGLEIVFASTAEGAEGTLVALEACVDHHVSLPVALALDDQAAHWALKWLPSLLRGPWGRGPREVCFSRGHTTLTRTLTRALKE